MTNRRILVAFGVALVLASMAMADSPRTRSGSIAIAPPAAADRQVYMAVEVPQGKASPAQQNLAEAAVWNQAFNGYSGIAAQNFEVAYNAYDVFVADDFTLTANADVTRFHFPGIFWNGGVFIMDGVNIWVHDDTVDGSGRHHPNQVVCSYFNVASDNGASNADVSVKTCAATPPYCRLNANTRYWAAVQVNMQFGPYGQWGSYTHIPVVGYEANWKNPNGGFGLPCPSYNYRCTVCGVCVGGDNDQAFDLYTGSCTGGGGGGGGQCDLAPIEAKLDDETRFTDDTELAVIEGKLDAIQATLAALPCDILEIFLPILNETLPTTHPCYTP